MSAQEINEDIVLSHREERKLLQMRENVIQTNLGMLSVVTVILIASYVVMIFENDQPTLPSNVKNDENYSLLEIESEIENLLSLNETLGDKILQKGRSALNNSDELLDLKKYHKELGILLNKVDNLTLHIKLRRKLRIDHMWHLFNQDQEKIRLWKNLTESVKGMVQDHQENLKMASLPHTLINELENIKDIIADTSNFIKNMDRYEEVFFHLQMKELLSQTHNKDNDMLIQHITEYHSQAGNLNASKNLANFESWIHKLSERINVTETFNLDWNDLKQKYAKNDTLKENNSIEVARSNFLLSLDEINNNIVVCRNTFREELNNIDKIIDETIPEFNLYSSHLKDLKGRIEKIMNH